MKLRKRIIVRQEADGWLLYNGDNGGLVRVAHDSYKNYFIKEDTKADGYIELHDWLASYGFLNSDSMPPNQHGSAAERAAGLNAFFSLKSEYSPINILWAITPRCNLRCIYCFPDAKSHSRRFVNQPIEDLFTIAEQIVKAKVLKVILSGGECLLHPQIWKIVEFLRHSGLSVTILSNGGSVTESIAERSNALGLSFGISLDGPNEKLNSLTRGANAYDQSIKAIRTLINLNVPLAVMTTLTAYNFDYIERLVCQLDDEGVDSITFQDLRPFATKEIYDKTRLNANQEQKLKEIFSMLYTSYPHMNLRTSELFFWSKKKVNNFAMQCPAGDHFCYIDFYGDVYPCTALPSFKLGNLYRSGSLMDLWRFSQSILSLRKLKRLPLIDLKGCADCADEPCCDGGCRGDALFYSGDLYGRPSRCPKELGIKH